MYGRWWVSNPELPDNPRISGSRSIGIPLFHDIPLPADAMLLFCPIAEFVDVPAIGLDGLLVTQATIDFRLVSHNIFPHENVKTMRSRHDDILLF